MKKEELKGDKICDIMIDSEVPNIIEHYGVENQIIVAIEELSELQKELCKYLRGEAFEPAHLAEEMADAVICYKQLLKIFNNADLVDAWKQLKIVRLKHRMYAGEE